MKIKIYVPDIECDSCVRLISKKLDKDESIDSFKIVDQSVEVNFNESLTNSDNIINIIKKLKYRASLEPFERKSFKERFNHVLENKTRYKTELKVFSYSIKIFLILFLLEFLMYQFHFKNIADFLVDYSWWIFYLNISIATLSMAIWHLYSYKFKVTCMMGMMLGMTVGMQSGMMLGAVIGATNGFFIGALVGMIVGTIVGAITGKGCGIMGLMEGMMAGVMGGTMGPMISAMMPLKELKIFMPFYMVINVIILWGMSYMIYEEVVEGNEHVTKRHISFKIVTSLAIITTIILSTIMVYGPKPAFF